MFHEAVVVCVMGLQSLLGAAPDGPGLTPEQAKDNVILSASKAAKASADAGVAVPEKKAPAAASATISYAVGWRIEHLGKTGDLGEAELAELRQQFQVRSVRQRGRIYRNR